MKIIVPPYLTLGGHCKTLSDSGHHETLTEISQNQSSYDYNFKKVCLNLFVLMQPTIMMELLGQWQVFLLQW